MIKKIEGIVVSEIDYKESSKIINVLSKEYGVIGIIARGTKQVKTKLGGAANVAHNLSLLGNDVTLISSGSKDANTLILQQELTNQGIKYDFVYQGQKQTTTKIRIMSGHQQMLRVDFEDDLPLRLNEQEIIDSVKEYVNQVDALVISDYNKGLCTANICSSIIRYYRKHDKLVFVDPKDANWDKYMMANYITPNMNEFNLALSHNNVKSIMNIDKDVENIAPLMVNKYILDGLILTRSDQGLSVVYQLADTVEFKHIKAQEQEVFDVSGAGDTVISVFVAAMLDGMTVEESARLANLAAGYVVSKIGTYAISKEELIQLKDK